jgi:hypothetical protein
MARKNFTEEFRRQAVDLYRSTSGATLRGIAVDLGISRHTLHKRADLTVADLDGARVEGQAATFLRATLSWVDPCDPISGTRGVTEPDLPRRWAGRWLSRSARPGSTSGKACTCR